MGEADLYSPFMVSGSEQEKPYLLHIVTRSRNITSYTEQYTLMEMVTYPSCACSYLQQYFSCLIKRVYKGATEYGRAGALDDRCPATDVVRSAASSFTLSAGLSSTKRMELLVCRDVRVCGFCKRVSRSDGHCALENV